MKHLWSEFLFISKEKWNCKNWSKIYSVRKYVNLGDPNSERTTSWSLSFVDPRLMMGDGGSVCVCIFIWRLSFQDLWRIVLES